MIGVVCTLGIVYSFLEQGIIDNGRAQTNRAQKQSASSFQVMKKPQSIMFTHFELSTKNVNHKIALHTCPKIPVSDSYGTSSKSTDIRIVVEWVFMKPWKL